MSVVDRACVAALVMALTVAAPRAAGADLISGDLERWLDAIAAPALARELASHPRFRGETLSIAPPANLLAEAVAGRLALHLRARPGIRLALARTESCAEGTAVNYRIHVQAHADGSDARLTIAVADVDERTWVGGLSWVWEGSAARAQRSALAESAVLASPTLAQTGRIVDSLVAATACRFPVPPAVAVHVERPRERDARLERIAHRLEDALSDRAWRLTGDAEAAWRLRLVQRGGIDGSTLELIAIDRDHSTSQVVARAELAAEPPPAEPLLADVTVAPGRAKGVCRGATRGCAEVNVSLIEPAWLVVFSTHSGEVRPLACEAPKRGSGERSYRVRVRTTAAADRPGAGMYVLASRDRALAAELAGLVASAPGACRGAVANPHWFAAFERTVAAHANRIDWRAVHLRDGPDGLSRL
jgi:hypothetical protein